MLNNIVYGHLSNTSVTRVSFFKLNSSLSDIWDSSITQHDRYGGGGVIVRCGKDRVRGAFLIVKMHPTVGRTLLRRTALPTAANISSRTACLECLTATKYTGRASTRPYYNSSAADKSNGLQRQSVLDPLDSFARRHIGPSSSDAQRMLETLDPPVQSLDAFVKEVLPAKILSTKDIDINGPDFDSRPEGFSETELIARLRKIAKENKVMRSYIGCGYAGTKVPEVIKRNVLEGPGWYTSYTPYQPEISQGRLESLLNFQTVVTDLTALSISNASVLDEPTAAAEAMTLSMNALPVSRQKRPNKTFLVSHLCHPQTIAVLESRADGFGIKIVVADILEDNCRNVKETGEDLIGVLVQYPDTEGGVETFQDLADVVHGQGSTLCVATDLLALTLLKPPGEFGADIALSTHSAFGFHSGMGVLMLPSSHVAITIRGRYLVD